MSKSSTPRDLKEILAQLRTAESSRELHKLSDRVDQHMMLSALDVAEWKGRLAPFLDVRSMGFATGVEAKYSAASLRRLSTVKSSQGGTRLIKMNARFHPRQAEIYCINPVFPLVLSFDRAREGKTLPRAKTGDPSLFGKWGVYIVPSLRERTNPVVITDESHTLIEFFSDPGLLNLGLLTTQEGRVRRGLLIGRTSLGVALGKPAVAVYLVLNDEWQTVNVIAGKLGMKYDYTYRLLSRILAPMGLARSSMREYVGSGQRQLWHVGVPIEECHPKNLPDVVDARLRRWVREREARKVKFPVTEEEYIAAEISAMAERIES